MPIAKYTSAKGLFELTDTSAGFFIEDAPLVQEQQALTLTHSVYTVTCVADQDKDNTTLANAAGGTFSATGELIGDYFELYDTDGNKYYVWYQDGTGTGTDPNPGGTPIEVALSDDGADDAATVAQKTADAIDAVAAFFSEHDGAGVLKIQPVQPGKIAGHVGAAYNLPTSNDAVNAGGNVTTFTVALAQASDDASAYAVNDHGVTIFTLGTDPTYSTGGAGSNPTVVALDNGSYVGQKKILNLSAAGSQSETMEITGAFIDSDGTSSRTKVTLAAANDSMHCVWTGQAWVNILETGSANMA